MKSAAEPRRNGPGGGAVRPFLLAAGLGLFWFTETPEIGLPAHVPVWGVAMVVASRLLLDCVGGALIVSIACVIVALGRLALTRWRVKDEAG
ncbi:MAG TPA: hypothetical protein VJ770_28045 [Stellaceae bacterium]|nr:hypothetical protein [Stellaceae bacterium]